MWLTLLAVALAAPPTGGNADHALQPPVVPSIPLYRDLPAVTEGPDVTVYGYKAYWSGDLATLPWDDLSHVALFAAAAGTDGSLSNTSRWGDVEAAVAIAETYDVRVHLTVTNFDTAELEVLLGSATARQALIDALAAEVAATGAHGVNIDFEGVPGSRRSELVTFTRDLAQRVPEVVLASPSVDWKNAWDYAALTQHADLFIMGYGYHWSGSVNAGPVDPLYGGGVWNKYALDWTVADYVSEGADPERVILGLPLYGYAWPTANNNVPGDNTGSGSSEIFSEVWAKAATHGKSLESGSRTPYTYDGTHQSWFGDADTVAERIRFADDESLQGVGFWALGYTGVNTDFWSRVHDETHIPLDPPVPNDEDTASPNDEDTGSPPPAVNTDYIANANRPFLAYPNERIQLSGESSTGPEGAPLEFLWIQVAGPGTSLSSTSSATPIFQPTVPGVYAFELAVGDGISWSAADRTHVMVIDREGGERYGNCGCSGTGGSALGWLGLLALGFVRTRRR